MEERFGMLLREWRGRRRMSQLDLSLEADVSARHIAFLETGRARPSRSMIMQLAEALQAPFAARNDLLQAAGFAPRYRDRRLDDDEMAQVRAALEWTLSRHDPFPGLALDRHWRVRMANHSAQKMLALFDVAIGDSLLDKMFCTSFARERMENFPVVARHLVRRLRTESSHLGGDPVLDQAIEKLSADAELAGEDDEWSEAAVLAAQVGFGGARLQLFSTIAHFGSAEDIAIADLKIELMFPADDETRRVFMGEGTGGG